MENQPHTHYRRHAPSLFFPIFLIAAGIVWLMINSGQVPVENVYRIFPYWPLLLIGGGLSLMLQRISWFLSSLIWVGIAALAVWLIITPNSALPVAQPIEMKHKTFSQPLDGAKKADVRLNLSLNPAEIYTLSNSNSLMDADIYYTGALNLSDSGSSSSRSLKLGEDFSANIFDLPASFSASGTNRTNGKNVWKIGLSPRAAFDLEVSEATGTARLDLQGLQLDHLKVNGGAGAVTINLPQDSPTYDFEFHAGTGSAAINAPSGSVFNLNVKASTGSLVITLPSDSGVQVEIHDAGTGSITLPKSYSKVKSGNDQGEGTWQNDAFANSKSPIKIVIDGSVGSVQVKE